MVLAFIAVLVVAGPGLVFAVPPQAAYQKPKSSILIGPATVAPGATDVQYTLRVTFEDNSTADFPPETGATFSAVRGSIDGTGLYDAPATTGKDRVSGSFTSNGVTTTANKFILVQ
jgi:hypothetical protein